MGGRAGSGGAGASGGQTSGGAAGVSGGAGGSVQSGGSAGTAGTGGGEPAAPLYVIANEIYTADETLAYINVVDSLDVTALDPAQAIEYAGGRATIGTVGGWLFVAGPETPVVTRFSPDAAGRLREDGSVGFTNYGFTTVGLDDWGNTFVSSTKAYLFNYTDGTTVIWNPTTLEIVGEVNQDGFDLVRSGFDLDGSPGVVRGDRLFRTISWFDWTSYQPSAEQYLAVYDVETDVLLELVEETRCPSLGNRVERDEAGNLYFSNWIWIVGATLVGNAPPNCALRLAADSERFDAGWSLPFASVTAGREGGMFSYLGNGSALISVFHDERVNIDATTAPNELASTENWRLWTVDVPGSVAAPLPGVEWNTGAVTSYHLDGRSFLMVPGPDWSVTRLYEVHAGAATHQLDIPGWSYQYLKLR